MEEPRVSVGIMSAPTIQFDLIGQFEVTNTCPNGADFKQTTVEGIQEVTLIDGKISWNHSSLVESICFVPKDEEKCCFELKEVTIGVDFHWQRKENQRFKGALELIVEGERLTAVNHVRVEDYLTSVISSEMSANASLELLKAHAVISRSWLLASMNCIAKNYPELISHPEQYRTTLTQHTGDGEVLTAKMHIHDTKELTNRKNGYDADQEEQQQKSNCKEMMKWYERDAHTRFDVCADDHCQRYQGITRASRETVRQAIAATRGEVLTYEGSICDARFSKCCGGAFEEFEYCWDDIHYPYLSKKSDLSGTSAQHTPLPDLTQESEAEQWIRSAPDAFCHTTDKEILSQVLNNYDQETTDFYRWKVSYTQDELRELIRKRSGVDYGEIADLVPIARGTSGRLWKLKIVGTKNSCIIGKELEIRRTLSPSHLYSSAFVVDKEGCRCAEPNSSGISQVPERFILTGAGWGHGVGLCQIGAAVMGAKGYPYDAILRHYFAGADLTTLY